MKRYFAFVLLICSVYAQAALTVVADLGGETTAPYFEGINAIDRTLPLPADIHSVDENHFLPVISEKLTPGTLANRKHSLPGMTPIFLVGNDRLSQRWLKERLPLLQTLNATGLVVNVSDSSELATLRKIADNLSLYPTSGDDLASRLDIAHYPVLITGTGLEQ
ncbi:integrating conjugative element protein [Photorhabdus tasmaniensis]